MASEDFSVEQTVLAIKDDIYGKIGTDQCTREQALQVLRGLQDGLGNDIENVSADFANEAGPSSTDAGLASQPIGAPVSSTEPGTTPPPVEDEPVVVDEPQPVETGDGGLDPVVTPPVSSDDPTPTIPVVTPDPFAPPVTDLPVDPLAPPADVPVDTDPVPAPVVTDPTPVDVPVSDADVAQAVEDAAAAGDLDSQPSEPNITVTETGTVTDNPTDGGVVLPPTDPGDVPPSQDAPPSTDPSDLLAGLGDAPAPQ